MNGIEKITAKLNAEAQEEANAILAEAEAKSAAIKNEYNSKAKALFDSMIQEGKKLLASDEERLESSLAMQEKKELLALKQELVSAAFARAQEKITTLPEQQYIEFLAKQAAEAAAGGQGELILNDHDRAAFGPKVVLQANTILQKGGISAALVLSDETREMAAGLILKNGDIEVNCTVETLLALSRNLLAAEVAQMLF